ncbi:MAG TPA: MFS transporter [Chloroflexi bacterium]|nr:MFS transporter [Chloroflexota bacterium]
MTQTAQAEPAGQGAAQASQRIPLSSSRGRWLIVATALGSGMIFLDGSVVNVALPAIQKGLTAPLSGLQWIVNSYTLLLAALLMLGGGIGDTYGRKIAFQAGLVIFTLSSIACGFAPSIGYLIAARAAQGVGGALLVPGSLAMIKAVIEPADAGRAIGLWAGLSGVTSAVGPLLGGYLVGAASWRAIFFINVPLAAVTLWAMWVHVPESRAEEVPRSLDWPAGLTSITALGGITYALIEQPTLGWGNWMVITALVCTVVGSVLFVWRELSAAQPMIPLSAFTSRTFDGANLATIGVYFTFSGALLFLVLDLQQLQGFTPLESGAAFLPMVLLLLFLSPRIGALMTRFGARPLLSIGPIVIGLGFIWLARLGHPISYWRDVLPGVLILGVGMSIFVTPLTTTVMNAVPENLAGVASGISNTLTRIASLLAVALLGLVVANRFNSTLTHDLNKTALPVAAKVSLISSSDRLADDPVPRQLTSHERASITHIIGDSYIDGYRWAMAVCALLCFASAAIAFSMVRDEEMHS